MSTTIEPFTATIAEAQLDDLRTRLDLTRWEEQETVDDWSQGVPLAKMKALVDYWRNGYDWRRCEKILNDFGQFKTEIDGVDIHFLHVRSPHPNAMPLLMTHGWPGSVVEFFKVIGPLVDPVAHGGKAEDAFHVIAPSLPGYGFSGKPKVTGWNVQKVAATWIKLMDRLGYDRWSAQGGDWGCAITAWIGHYEPKGLIGIHLNCPFLAPPEDQSDFTPEEQQMFADRIEFYKWKAGYSAEQSTRPQTIGYSLVDSPVGLASWIYEKFYDWTDHKGTVESILTMDEVLDNIMLYWLPETGGSAARMYWESFRDLPFVPVPVPSGISIFPVEAHNASKRWCERYYTNLIYYNHTDQGGHFASFEQPDIFVDEVRKTFALLR